MTYTNINGSLFKKMVINGAINLKNNIYVNKSIENNNDLYSYKYV